MHQHIHGFDETPIVATSLGPRCAIAMSTAIIRLPIDHSDPRPSRNVSRTAVSNRDPHIRDYFQKTESDLTESSSACVQVWRRARHDVYT